MDPTVLIIPIVLDIPIGPIALAAPLSPLPPFVPAVPTIPDSAVPSRHRELRALVIEMVLATDMSCHFQQVKSMKTALQQLER